MVKECFLPCTIPVLEFQFDAQKPAKDLEYKRKLETLLEKPCNFIILLTGGCVYSSLRKIVAKSVWLDNVDADFCPWK